MGERIFLVMIPLALLPFEEPKGGYLVLDDFFPFFVASRHWPIITPAQEDCTQNNDS